MSIKAILKRILPKFVIDLWHKIALQNRIAAFTWKSVCERKIAKIRGKEVLTVLFLPINVAMWKYDPLFKKMMEHPRFRPLILPSPDGDLSKSEYEKEVKTTKKYFEEKGYPVVDEPSGINPDLVFITQGFNGHCYELKDFPKALGCYAPYHALPSSFSKDHRDLLDLNRAWRIFIQNKAAYDGTAAAMTNKGINVRITGHLNADRFLPKDTPFSFHWKSKNPTLKKVIYAPHFTVAPAPTQLPYSTFLSTGEIMLELAEKYADKIQ